MRRVVLDTSAIIRLYIPDGPVPAGLPKDVEDAARGDVALLVPEIALAEIGQVLARREAAGILTASECDEILDAILDLPLDVIGHRGLLRSALEIARKRNLTVYDGLFLALALDRRADLTSVDKRLSSAFAAESGMR